MKSCLSLIAIAVLLAWGPAAHADQTVRVLPAQGEALPPGDVVPDGASMDTDFPGYYPGFSSYRGLGFMGSCRQPCWPRAEHAWDGYCEGMECCEPAPWQGFFAKLHAWMSPPVRSCGPKGCDAGCGPCVKAPPVAPTCREPLCVKLQRLRAQCAGMFGGGCGKTACEPCVEEGTMFAPETIPMEQSVEPLPPPAAPAVPAPQSTGETRPNRRSVPTSERSAWRLFPWQLPGSGSGL